MKSANFRTLDLNLLRVFDDAQRVLARLEGVAGRTETLLGHTDERVFGPEGLMTDTQATVRRAERLMALYVDNHAVIRAFAERIRESMLPHLILPEKAPQVLSAALGDLGGAMGAALRVEHTVPPAGDLGVVADPDA